MTEKWTDDESTGEQHSETPREPDADKCRTPPPPPDWLEENDTSATVPGVGASPPPEAPALPEPVYPAELPRGFLNKVDYILRHPAEIRESLQQEKNLLELTRVFLGVTIVMAACYGVVMGGTNWVQGTDMPLTDQLLMMVSTGVKVPVLFLLTLLIVVAPVYVSSIYIGARMSFPQFVALLLGSLTITVITLASMASVAFFFALTTTSYEFIKLLHVLFFAYAGIAGMSYMVRCFNTLLDREVHRLWYTVWLALYMFVGTQLAWTLRPFVGTPGMEFQLFRDRWGNFYVSVLQSLQSMLGG
jgi:hypothetical protein